MRDGLGRTVRRILFGALIASRLTCVSAGGNLDENVAFSIDAQSLQDALLELSKQSSYQIVFAPAELPKHTTFALSGRMQVKAALDRLLAGTELSYKLVGKRTITIGHGNVAVPVRLQQAESPSLDSTESSIKVEEIVVTAQKRLERLQEVPVPVTAIRAEALVDSNQLRLQDYYTRIPGLSVTPGNVRDVPLLSIRGVTTGGATNPTVGVTVDDVPYGSSTSLGGGSWVPDLDPSDLAQLEVLRGPQGTLYGASSIGGLLKFVTVEPSTAGVTARVQAGVNSVEHGDETGYSVRGSLNVPLSDTWAIRASGFTRLDPGYIDNVQTGDRGVNRGKFHGGRVSALWKPSQTVSLKLSALMQDGNTDGSSNIHLLPGLGDLQQSTLINTGGYHKKFEVYSANLAAKLGAFDLTAVTGYSINTFADSVDYTPLLGAATASVFNGVRGTPLTESNRTSKLTQELRFSRALGPSVDWLFGAFYTDEKTRYEQNILAANENTGAVVGSWIYTSFPTSYEEYAAFTDFTFHFTDQFDIQVGGRQSRNTQTYSSINIGPWNTVLLGGSSLTVVTPDVDSDDSSFTYLVTPRFILSPGLMMYARLASGYRPGGPNSNNVTLGLPPTFAPDQTRNYEAGVKGSAFDRAFSYDASIYYIDWKDVQLALADPAGRGGYYANAGRAKSQGIELSMETKPLTGLTVGAWVVWSEAELTEDFPPESTAAGFSGARLPDSARVSANLSIDQELPLTHGLMGFVGASLSYIGDRKGAFVSAAALSPERQTYPSYTRTDVRAGVRYESWTVNLFVNNLTDKRVFVEGGIGSLMPFSFNYIQPRSAGLSLSKTFE